MIIKPKRQRVYIEMNDGSFEYLSDGEYELINGDTLIINSLDFEDEIDQGFIFNETTKTLTPIK